jgi:hypothetical protein
VLTAVWTFTLAMTVWFTHEQALGSEAWTSLTLLGSSRPSSGAGNTTETVITFYGRSTSETTALGRSRLPLSTRSKDDGMKVWTGFEFDLSGFFGEPGVFALGFGAVSYCVDCNATPIIAVRGRFQGVPFVMKLHLEPVPESEPVEIIDTIKNETRAIRGRQP